MREKSDHAYRRIAKAWFFLRRVGLPMLVTAFLLGMTSSSVTLISFEATADGQVIRIT